MMVEPRENRVHMYLSNDEKDAIDDWRFQHRVATRSEAIRRLCQIGLIFDENRRKLVEKYQAETDAVFSLMAVVRSISEKDPSELSELERTLIMRSLDVVMASASLLPVIRTTTGLANNFKSERQIEEIMAEAKEILAIDEDRGDDLRSETTPPQSE
ncbi:hypothetical protein IFT66_14710 [Rhizobium sp. CFBP 13726]|uniref:hypothetical protein n=1 Tax=Rhizobium sp. CFBP 13726 TaxID=2775296 RepID=UPI00177B39A4|nr:hypothetical protein [Rhizobium sp. CFBP 13726]MBD8652337.1 hypothetical protein [Rhizobium sp. CFBP 13726]